MKELLLWTHELFFGAACRVWALCYTHTLGRTYAKYNSAAVLPEPRGEESVTFLSSMRSAPSPPNQLAERRVCVLTTSRSRRHGIQPTTASEPAQPTRPISAAFILIQTAHLRANLRKSYNQTALRGAHLRKFSETIFGLLTTPSWQIPWDDDAAANTNCRPAAS